MLNQFSPPFTGNIAQKPPCLKTVGAFKWALLRIHFSGALQMPFGSVMRPMSFCRVADIRTNFKLGRRCITTSSPTGAEPKGGGGQSTYSSIYQSLYLCICIVFLCIYMYKYIYISGYHISIYVYHSFKSFWFNRQGRLQMLKPILENLEPFRYMHFLRTSTSNEAMRKMQRN